MSFWPLFKHHLRDWVIIVIMAILEIIDYVLIPPYHRFVSEHNINNFTFPSNKYTVPTWSVLVRIIISSLNFLFNLARPLQHVDKILLSIQKRTQLHYKESKIWFRNLGAFGSESEVLEENLILGFDCFLLLISLVVHCAVSGNCSDYSSTHILPVLLKAEKHPRLPQCFPWYVGGVLFSLICI